MRTIRKATAGFVLAAALSLGVAAQAQAAPAAAPQSGWDQHAIVAANGGYMNVFGYGGSGAHVGLWYTNGPTTNEIFYC